MSSDVAIQVALIAGIFFFNLSHQGSSLSKQRKYNFSLINLVILMSHHKSGSYS